MGKALSGTRENGCTKTWSSYSETFTQKQLSINKGQQYHVEAQDPKLELDKVFLNIYGA